MQKSKHEVRNIKLLVMDVDGTLTDGRINISEKGEMFKSFHVRDGYALKHILPMAQISTAIITGRQSQIVALRAKEIDIQYVYQNVSDKLSKLLEICEMSKIPLEQVAYIGDDLNDIMAMQNCGLAACPRDAVKEVKDVCDYVCKEVGGNGAVREFIDWIMDTNK